MKPIITKFNDKTGDFEITIPVPFTLKDGIEYVDMVVADIPKYEDKKDYNIFDLIRENQELKKQLKIKQDGFMASVEESCELAEENQKYKEVIDKAIEYINLIVLGETLNGEPVLFKEEAEGQYLLDVLKEVE